MCRVKPAKNDEPPNEVVWSPHHLEFSLTPRATQALHKAEQGILKYVVIVVVCIVVIIHPGTA